ncbi:MAG: hypothetical protein RLZZ238_2684 [Planctomycetota bacterium]
MKSPSLSRIAVYACVAAIVAVAWWRFDQHPSPGPLHSSHASVAALQGGSGCAACHAESDFTSRVPFAAACNACHEPIARQMAVGKGIHGSLETKVAEDCAKCHHEHIGDSLALVSLASFQRAGIPEPDLYEHEHAGGLALTGRHDELTCAGCHIHSSNPMLNQGEQRFLGLTQECTACHEDIHRGELGDDCAKCHGQQDPFKAATHFAHPSTFPLVEGHSQRLCSECHTTPAVFTGLKTDCASCHRDDYDRTSKPAHALTGLGTDCASCHGVAKWSEAKYEHDRDFPLNGAHGVLDCNDCHAPGRPQQEVVAFGKSRGCIECHRDDYDATTKPAHALTGLGTDCATCHGDSKWTPAEFSHTAKFALVGAHAPLACTDCHAEGTPQREVLAHAANASCTACHSSPHDETMVRRAKEIARAAGDSCTVCHAPTAARWSDANDLMTAALHAATGFELVPPHDTQSCAECHTGLARPVSVVAHRSEAEWKKVFPGRTQDACEACHDDPHDGQFEGSATGSDCLACHERTAFMPSRFDAAMHARCDFPLDGSHRAVACSACHEKIDGVRRFVGTKSECVACHEDIHKGAFDRGNLPREVRGRTDCARCHTTDTFAAVVWTAEDHRTWTGEELKGKHALAACADCHRRAPTPAAGGAAFVATLEHPTPFQPAPTACIECHADIHAGQFRPADDPKAITDCTRCHESFDSFKEITFDHQVDSRFPLDEDHIKLDCTACHKAFDVGGTAIVRYKPLGVTCADCHDPRGGAIRSGGARP